MEDVSSPSSSSEDASSPSALTGRRRSAQRYAQAGEHLKG